jgi:hypothetical protein
MPADLTAIYDRVYSYAEARGFSGFDPFDGLNSRLFQATPIKNYRLPRLFLTQLVKRSPVNLRPLLMIDSGVNPKGVALFALGEMSRYRLTRNERHRENARELLDRLFALGIRTEHTLAYGYNFDWQSRVFFAPKGTPAIVPTAFASQAFYEAAELFDDERYSRALDEIAAFVVNGLNRPVETGDEICFSYTPLDESVIFNASLLAGECLMRSSDPLDHELALKALNFVVRRQRDDGAWSYGDEAYQGWVDNFHTAYVLQSMRRIADVVGTHKEVGAGYEKGMGYWVDNFFLDDGTPKYYDHKTYPADIHSAAVAIAALSELGEIQLARKVADWTLSHMLDVDNFFYYQLDRYLVNQTPFMRWGQAWMAYAVARLIEAQGR